MSAPEDDGRGPAGAGPRGQGREDAGPRGQGRGGQGRRDPGLQPERTRLAWRRTTLSCTVVTVLAGKQAVDDGATAVRVLAAALSALVWVGFLVVAHGRMRELDRARPRALGAPRAWAGVCCALALAGCGVAVVR